MTRRCRRPPSNLLAALTYAEEGMAVFPLSEIGRPLVAWKDLQPDYDETERLFRSHPSAGIGVKLGRESGLWLLDIDIPSPEKPHRENGMATMRTLIEQHGKLPRTMMSSSPSGGTHLWFRYPDPADPTDTEIPNTVCKIGPSLDTKGKGGMGILPPTRVIRGEYTLEVDERPTPAPSWLLDLIAEKTKPPIPTYVRAPARNALGTSAYGLAALERASSEVAGTGEGIRHKELCRNSFSMGRLVSGGEIDLEDAINAMTRAGLACGLPERETRTTVKDAIQKGMMHPRNRNT